VTWREQIKRAHAAVGEAEAERTRIFAAALDAGVSTREISQVVGVPHSTVWRWAGGRRGHPSPLDNPSTVSV
jgi:transposase